SAQNDGKGHSQTYLNENGTPRLPITVFKAGSCTAREKFFLPGGAWRVIDIPALFAVIEHPEQGTIVFDTGYSPRFYEGTRQFPFKIMAYTTPTTVTDDDTAVAHVRGLGRDPADVRWLVLSHFDPDHYGGLKDFPNARIVCSHRAWAAVAGKTGLAAMKVRLLPGHLPEDMAARVLLLPDPDGPPIGVFPASLDIFGDSSIRLVELPGHATGQMGAFLTRSDGTEMFLAADSCWNMASLENDSYGGGLHRWIAVDRRGQDATYATMRRLRREWPSLLIVPAHCPRMWRELSAAQQGEINE
ncbi:MAG: MBL fold metallo-hydrolase, partial [Candidatus Hydrogenedentales bacterium]